MKHKITKITIRWSEADFTGPRDFDTIEAASAFLSSLGHPKGGGYYKTGFEIVWENGDSYEGRIDLDGRYPDLREHIKRVLLFSAGAAKPSGWSNKTYAMVLGRSDQKETATRMLAECEV